MTDSLAVLVPVLGRPQNVAPLVESFLAGCPTGSHLHFLMSEGDTAEGNALTDTMMTLSRDGVHLDGRKIRSTFVNEDSWPHKINAGVHVEDGVDWYLCAADDITFTPGWWDATTQLRENPAIGVIGTHDSHDGTGNAAVAGHTHTCHPLIRGDYIRDHGTIDQRGVPVHDGYRHWYVDNELVITAKLRDAWAFCPDAVLEHHHPYWGYDVPFDQTYQLGESNAEHDLKLWQWRWLNLFEDGRHHTIWTDDQ